MTRTRPLAVVIVASGLLVLVSCAPKPPTLPSGTGEPFAEYSPAYGAATNGCRAVRTLTAAIALSGRVGRAKLRGRLLGGVAEPDGVRLEAPGPGSRPFFVFVARGGRATLLLPRDERVLTNANPSDVLETLAGISLDPAELRWILSGCATAPRDPAAGRRYDASLVSVDLKGATPATVYLRQTGDAWRLIAAKHASLTIHYADFTSGFPGTIRLVSTPGAGTPADLTLRLSQIETNAPLGAEAFTVRIPPGAEPITLEELREAGPLGRR